MNNNFDTNTKLSQAISFAIEKHMQFKQTREDLTTPYHVHILRVVERLQKVGVEEKILIAAALHDLVEDCQVTYDEIQNLFGEKVRQFVEEVTINPNETNEGVDYVRKLQSASLEGQTIKLADKLDNIWELRTKKYPTYGGITPKEYCNNARLILTVCKNANKTLAGLLNDEICLLEATL